MTQEKTFNKIVNNQIHYQIFAQIYDNLGIQ